MPDSWTIASFFLAVIAVIVSILSLRESRKQSEKSLFQTQQVAISQNVIHFTDRFFQLLQKGTIRDKLKEDQPLDEYWSLYATEFYFFHHRLLPHHMFSLWMTDLAELYANKSNGEKIWESHKTYLKIYSQNYPEMCQFFELLYEIAKKYRDSIDETQRNQVVMAEVKKWFETHNPPSLIE